MRVPLLLVAFLQLIGAAARADAAPDLDWNFESGHVRPLALSPDGRRLFAVNTPDARLEIFRIIGERLIRAGSVPVGLEPVAVAARSNDEVWVVNRLSDSVSVVRFEDVVGRRRRMHGGRHRIPVIRGRVVRTLLVGDEPQDVVFAGPDRRLAFVTAAHRGQNSPFPRAQYAEPGVGRADIWVFDVDELGASLGGQPRAVLALFGDSPRALAASPDGSRVYAAVYRSGNGTNVTFVCAGGADAEPCRPGGGPLAPGGLPAPNENVEGVPGPLATLIVRRDPETGAWLDELNRDWTAMVPFELPDLDVFEIDALTDPPVATRAHAAVGTVLFNMVVNPKTGRLYVSNTEARNEVRFEGPGHLAALVKPPGEPASVRGHLHEARITVIDGEYVKPRHLNKHIPYDPGPTPRGVKARSLATPTGMVVSRDGRRLYVAALGSNKVGVFDARRLERDRFLPSARRHIALRGRGPTGLALRGKHLYVMTRFDHAIEVVDLRCRCTVQRVALHDTEPETTVQGRPFLYDATISSSNGETSCAACHVFGHTDALAWDLGNPDAAVVPNPNLAINSQTLPDFHPLKGPFLTQTLRGLARHGPMHWRGDRTGGPELASPEAELAAFQAFNGAFESLLGRDEGPLPADDMRTFAEFATRITMPPSPIARFDGELRADEARGRELFFEAARTVSLTAKGNLTFETCDECHRLDPAAGLFGTSTLSTIAVQSKKVPQLRALYDRIGKFGFVPAFDGMPDADFTGPQVRASGFSSGGGSDTLFRFLGNPAFVLSDAERRDLEAFLLAFPSRLAPIVGQQVTLGVTTSPEVDERLDLLLERAATPHPMDRWLEATACDLVARGTIEGEPRGFLRTADGRFQPDRSTEPALSAEVLRSLAAERGQELTFTCAPPGAGRRLGIDRDLDGAPDGDERDAGSNPADPRSLPRAH
jgi:DNA-binding beta-propeller fold protein YncE